MTEPSLGRSSSGLPREVETRLREELGLAFLPTVFALLAEHERYLLVAIDAFLAQRPDGREEHATQTRWVASQAAAAMVGTPLRPGSDAPALAALIDVYNQVNPPSLLFTLFLAPPSPGPFRVMEPPLPPAPGASDAEALLADIRACHGGFKVPGFWREFVTEWGEHAVTAWAIVRRLASDPAFARARETVIRLATVKTTPGAPTPLALGYSAAQADEIAAILSFYAVVIPTMVIEIECLRRALALGAHGVQTPAADRT